jgi:FkbM family methyltransferase
MWNELLAGDQQAVKRVSWHRMIAVRRLAPAVLRQLLAIGFNSCESIQIMKGPLRGRRLPTQLALNNLPMIFGRYEPVVVTHLMAIAECGSVAYDIGSHFGFMSLVLASCVGAHGKVIAFEPAPDNLVKLNQVMLLNKVDSIVSILPKAVSDTVGEIGMMLGNSSYMNFLQKAAQGQDEASCQKITAKTTTVDSFVLEEKHPPPNLLKIDVEGSESLVIEGALTTLQVHSPTLLIEIHGPAEAAKLWDLLHTVGYGWWRLTPGGLMSVSSQAECVKPFSPKAWTHHYLMNKCCNGLRHIVPNCN